MAQRNGNGKTATERWKLGITDHQAKDEKIRVRDRVSGPI